MIYAKNQQELFLVTNKKKYTIVFIESEAEIIICEFISSKLIYW